MDSKQGDIKEIIEGNRMIAEFMGNSISKDNRVKFIAPPDGMGLAACNVDWMQYHNRWQWLMPVVIKIAETSPDHEFVIEFGKTFTDSKRRHLDNGKSTEWNDGEPDNRIQPIYQTVIDFIKYHNETAGQVNNLK